MLPSRISYMSELLRYVDSAEASGAIKRSTLLTDDECVIRGVLMEDDDGASIVTAPRGVVACERFQHLEDAVVAAETVGLALYDPYSAAVPIVPRWKLD